MTNQKATPTTQEIEIELKKLKELQSQTTLKPCLFNLVIYSEDPRQTANFQDIIRMISGHFPFRSVFIQRDRNSKNSHLRVHTSSESNNPNLACDQILLEAAGDGLQRIPFLIIPYLVPDLPIYLLWGQDPAAESIILPYLQNFATRLIFDSEEADDLQQFSVNMLAQRESFRLPVSDLNWARMGGWREIFAETFDTQEKIQHLSSSKTIKIVYNNRASDLFLHPETQSIYLQGWLASRLKWKFEKLERQGRTLILHYQSGTNPIEIRLEGQSSSELPAEEILEIEASDPSNFLYSMKRKGKSQVLVYCHRMDRCELPLTFMLSNIWTGKNFIREVFYQNTGDQYFQMLHLISTVKWNQPL